AAGAPRSDGPGQGGGGRGTGPGDPAPPGRGRLRVAAAQGRIAVSGAVPARSGRRGQGGLGIRAARPARRPASHLRINPEGATPAPRRPRRGGANSPRPPPPSLSGE